MDIQNYHFFDISFDSLNLFSFMLGMVWAFFNQGVFGRRIATPIFLYFAGLAAWFALQYYIATASNTKKVEEPNKIEILEPRTPKKEVVGENGVRWIASDSLPPEWGVSQDHIDKLLGKLPTYSQKD